LLAVILIETTTTLARAKSVSKPTFNSFNFKALHRLYKFNWFKVI
jgi:hypothetical protein